MKEKIKNGLKFRKRYTIDLYNKEDGFGIEVYWRSGETFEQLRKKLNNYKKYFGEVICALIKDSSRKSKNRIYPILKRKLKNEKFKVIIVDISKTPPITETQ